jgi:predicted nucleotidyltransferase
MVVNGIIAEYNPFHNGHALQIRQGKEETGADYTIVVMSGNFVQRGAPTMLDKYSRTRMALEGGADLVLELPAPYAVASAEYFATGGVNLLHKLGVVTHLIYGVENGSLQDMERIADVLLEEPEDFRRLLLEQQRGGTSYPLARNNALVQYDPSLFNASTLLGSPNNILAVEYLKALKRSNSSILPHPILRQGSNYHDRYLGNQYTSATAIRHAVTYGENLQSLENVMHASAFDTLMQAAKSHSVMDVDDFSEMLLYKLLNEADKGFEEYLDVDRELSDRIVKNLGRYTRLSEFIDYLKTKDKTYTRVSRALFHILLDIKDTDIEKLRLINTTPYARILGFRKESEGLLTLIKSRSSIPMISKYSEAKRLLYHESFQILEKGVHISDIYNAAVSGKTHAPLIRDLTAPVIVLKDKE